MTPQSRSQRPWRAVLIGLLFASFSASAMTLTEALERCLKNYPSIRVSQEEMNAAGARIQLARTAYLPRVDALAQVNRATRNNVFGLLLPQSVLPSISGPVIGSNNLGSVWGTAVGGLVSWEPFDFGLRSANVAVAIAARAQGQAAVRRTQFEILVATADAYLTVIAAQETVRSARAGVERAEVLVRTIISQVNAGLRPGAEKSRAEAEEAAARTQLIQVEQAVEVARAMLSQFVGGEPSQVEVSTGGLAQSAPEQEPRSLEIASHPVALEQSAVLEHAQAQMRVLERSYFPKFELQAAAYARGTGADVNGSRLGGANGLGPNVQNYALGLTITFPLLDFVALRAREAAQGATIRSQAARSEQIAVDLRAQWNRSVAILNGARRVAGNTPVQVAAARAATQQATARFEAGLGNINEVAEAQRLLTQAEIDDVLARINVWRGLLGIAGAAGDIQPFVVETTR